MLKYRKKIRAIVLTKSKFIILIISLGIIALLCFVKFYRSNKTTLFYANTVLRKCQSPENDFTCYDNEIPRLLRKMSMEQVFEVAKIVQQKDTAYNYCHVLGHNIASAETKRDPNKWKEIVARCPVGVCSNGCVHGAFQEKFRAENLPTEKIEEIKPDLEDVCEPRDGFNPSGLEQGSCYHALGHLFMYITQADIEKSTVLCDELTFKKDGRDFRPICYDGAFMQIFQPLEAEDEVLVYGKVPQKAEVWDYCSGFSGEALYSCWNESWPLSLGGTPSGNEVVSFCSKLDAHGQEECYTDMFYLLPIGFEFDFDRMNRFCNDFPSVDKKELCYTTFVQRIIEIDYRNKKKATDFCLSAQGESFKDACFRGLGFYSNFVFHPESDEVRELCSYFPEKFNEYCGKGYQ